MVPLHANSPSTFTLPLFTGLTVFVAIEPLSDVLNDENDASPLAVISPSILIAVSPFLGLILPTLSSPSTDTLEKSSPIATVPLSPPSAAFANVFSPILNAPLEPEAMIPLMAPIPASANPKITSVIM